ncbi:MAG TPA: hypothetical protein VKW76_09680 [Candidatus Binatia bacterium]|nr:hypothetical protein [Candidatus Binatia bacterium]
MRDGALPARRGARSWVRVCAVLAVTAAARVTAADPVSRDLPSYVIVALHKFKMKDFGFTVAGNVGVDDAGGTLAYGRKAVFPDRTQLVSDIVEQLGNQSSLWDLFANQVNMASLAQSTIRNQGPTPWSPALFAALPCQPPCSPGTTPVSVQKYGSADLPPGSYGAVVVGDQATLTLSGGTYCLASLKAGHHARVRVAGPATVNVAGNVKLNLNSSFGPAMSSGLGATDVRLAVGGTSVIFTQGNRVTADVVACNAKMRFGRFASLTGQFIADQFKADFGPTFTLQDCGNGIVDPGEQCDAGAANGQPGSCCDPNCHFDPAGSSCSDGNVCNGLETCNAIGGCVPGTPLDCRDGNLCTEDRCDPTLGCQHSPVEDGTSCSDGNVCNGAETCQGGTCTPGTPLTCNPPNGCYTASCAPTLGCQLTPVPGCVPCTTTSDCNLPNGPGTLCTPEVCVAGTCQAAPPPNCDDGNPCTSDTCNPLLGCQHTSNNGAPCDDGNACTTGDVCVDSVCEGTPLSCNDGNPCTSDSCDMLNGCSHTPIPNCPATGTLCTLTQGAYGAPNGIANGSGTHGPLGWITANPSVLPAFVGLGGQSVTIANQTALEAFMPTGGTPAPLHPGNVVLSSASGIPANGDGGGTLAGQTLALTLSTALSNIGANPPGLGGLALAPLGSPFCTCAGGGPTAFSALPACILSNAATVQDLIVLGDRALGGVPLTAIDSSGRLTYSGIESALDTINNAFDQCRQLCPCS